MLKFIELQSNKTPTSDGWNVTYKDTDTLEHAGLLLNSKVVVVDFDNDNADENNIIMYLMFNYPTQWVKTSRGIHFYYSTPKAGVKIKSTADRITVGGFQVDYKTGKAYSIVKTDGVDRERSAPKLTLTDLPELPFILWPLAKAKNITALEEGDGRNNALFYHLRLVREQFRDSDRTEIANIINHKILAEPLEDKELKTLIESVEAQEVHSKGQYNGNSGDMIDFGKFLVDELDMKIYNYNLYFKDDINYSKEDLKLLKEANRFLALRKQQWSELKHQLLTYSELIDHKQDFKVKLRNGVIIDDQVLDIDYGFTPFYMDISYDPDAYDPTVDDFLDFICEGREDMRIVIEEILGHILLVNRFPHKVFFLTGEGNNGKSTFVEMVTKFAGEMSSHIDIADFDDGTSVVSLVGKLVNIADDVDALYIEKSKNLKTMASGNTVGARAIYSQPVTIKNTATLIFTANEPPTFKDKSGGIGRRFVIIPFDNTVKKVNLKMDELLSSDQAKSYLLNLGLAGISRLQRNHNKLSESPSIEQATQEYHLSGDSVLSYLNENPIISGTPCNSTYTDYEEFCNEANLKPVSATKFTRRLKGMGHNQLVRKIVGKSTRIWE